MTVRRYQNIVKELRICNKCNINVVGYEYHVILECNKLKISHAHNIYSVICLITKNGTEVFSFPIMCIKWRALPAIREQERAVSLLYERLQTVTESCGESGNYSDEEND